MDQIGFAVEVERAPMSRRERVMRAVLWPVGAFQPSRQVRDAELLIDGEPAKWTTFDQARFDQHRRAVEVAEAALDRARWEQGSPYSLADMALPVIEQKIRRAGILIRAVGVACVGAGIGILGAIEASQPDSVLAQRALKDAPAFAPPSASDERIFYLWLSGAGVLVLIAGLYFAREWFRAARR